MRAKYAREIRAGLLLARNFYPVNHLPEVAEQTHPLYARAFLNEWCRQVNIEAKKTCADLDFSPYRAFRASFIRRK